MGFFGSLIFQQQFWENLTWSLFAVGYPLLATVKAMENKSNNDLRKLVAYWILFFLFSLFELVLSKFIHWIPFWSCIKLGTVCWLTLPQFQQAYFVYSHHIHPILLLINSYCSMSIKKFLFNKKIIRVLAEIFVQVNGSEAFEDLIGRKLTNTSNSEGFEDLSGRKIQLEREPSVENEDLIVALIKEGSERFGTIVQDTFTLIEEKQQTLQKYQNHAEKSVDTLIKEQVPLLKYNNNAEKVAAFEEPPKVFYRCGACDVTVTCKNNLLSHFEGRKHKKVLMDYNTHKNGYSCSLCNVWCSTLDYMESHLYGKKHLKLGNKVYEVR